MESEYEYCSSRSGSECERRQRFLKASFLLPGNRRNLEYGDGDGDDEFSLSVDQLNQEFHRSLDLENFLPDLPPTENHNLSMKEAEVPDRNESKRRYGGETGRCRDENESYLDLKLSPPGESKSSPPTSVNSSCISVEVESNDNCENNPPFEGSPLIVMGCSLCLLYVMVPDSQPRCPKCNNSGLLDIFRGNQAKRSRKN